MASVNKVILIGNLGKDPEIRTTPQGTTPRALLARDDDGLEGRLGRQAGADRVARHRRLGEARADLRRVPAEGQAGLRRGQPADPQLGRPERAEALQDRDQGLQRRDARSPRGRRARRAGAATSPRRRSPRAAEAAAAGYDDDVPF